jgi:molybdopterin-guanine dinucleotide biosynthesis protein A
MMDISAAILAGGKSTRFGRDKAMLKLNNCTLIDRTYRELLNITDDIWVVGDLREDSLIPLGKFLPDLVDNIGPLGGLFTALSYIKTPVLLTSFDMPFLKKKHFEFVVQHLDSSFEAIIATSDKGIEPLLGIYRPPVLPIIKECIDHGTLAMYQLIEKLKVKFVDFKNAGYISDLFFNINTMGDYKKLLTRSIYKPRKDTKKATD